MKLSGKLLVALLLFGVFPELSAQNLVPNGSFEETDFFQYEFPFSAFPFVKDWESSSFLLFDPVVYATPDLFVDGESLPSTSLITFWNAASGAYDGLNYVGLRNTAAKDGVFLPETITTRLTEPMEAGAFYAVNLFYRNKGLDEITENPMPCIEESQKKLVAYFDDSPISVAMDIQANTSIASSDQFVDLVTPSMEAYEVLGWERVGTCYQARGGEQYFALSMLPGRIEVYPPCEIMEESFDQFIEIYFDVDEVVLERLPDAYIIETTLCNNRPVTLNLRDSIRFPAMGNPVSFSFNGADSDGIVTLTNGGRYTVYVQLDCARIPITINAEELDCTPGHYAPNVFSPNDDGINDNWGVFLKPSAPTKDFSLSVYDKSGALVFETIDPTARWSGKTRDFTAHPGVYVWVLSYTYMHPELGPLPQEDCGDFMLIR